MKSWLLSGPMEHWRLGVEKKQWGVVGGSFAVKACWSKIEKGDILYFYATQPVKGLVGVGIARGTSMNSIPLWPEEVEKNKSVYSHRILIEPLIFVDNHSSHSVIHPAGISLTIAASVNAVGVQSDLKLRKHIQEQWNICLPSDVTHSTRWLAMRHWKEALRRSKSYLWLKKQMHELIGDGIRKFILAGVVVLASIMGSFFFGNDIRQNSTQVTAVIMAEDKEAAAVVADFYRYWNLHRFEDARALLTPQYAGKHENYSVVKLREFSGRIEGGITVSGIQMMEGESRPTSKVFEYQTSYQLREDSRQHGEKLRAYVVLRNGRWTIDTIQVQNNY